MKRLRWFLADWLSYVARKLRGDRWYVPNNYSCIPGNRAAELRQAVWEQCVVLKSIAGIECLEWLAGIDRDLSELGQLAGENWGHIQPPCA